MFFSYLNKCHPNIKFTMKTENDGKLLFFIIIIVWKWNGNDMHANILYVPPPTPPPQKKNGESPSPR